jgi:hypothetical protein
VYRAITALLSAAVIIFFLVRHFLLDPPLVWTTSPDEAIFPSTLKLDCQQRRDKCEKVLFELLSLSFIVTIVDLGFWLAYRRDYE